MLKDILEIHQFVTSVYGKQEASPERMAGKKQNSLLLKFARGVHEKKFSDDCGALKYLFGSDGKNGSSYRILKFRYKERLLDLLFLRDMNRQLRFAPDRALFNLQRTMHAATILFLRDHIDTSITLIKPAVNSAIQFNHTHIAVHGLKLLCRYAAFRGLKNEFRSYNELLRKQIAQYKAETEIEQILNTIISSIVNVTVYSLEISRLLKKSYAKSQKIVQQFPSHNNNLRFYRISVHYFHHLKQYRKIISLSRECQKYLTSNPHLFQRSVAGEFSLMEMEAWLQLCDFRNGHECAKRCLMHFPVNSSHWYIFNEYYFLLAMRTGNYTDALQIFYAAASFTRFKKLPSIQQERWRIFEAYLNFVLPDELPKKNFRLFKFVNEVSLAGKDKGGYNFSILIAQIILLINIDELFRLIDLERPFRLYCSRYIKQKTHPRHFAFAKLIKLYFKHLGQNAQIKEPSRQWLYFLKCHKSEYDAFEESEIIPYETLWKMILKKNRVYR